MNHHPFSAAMRRWASDDRRGFLRRVAAATVALPFAGAEGESAAGKRRTRKRCKGGKKRCGQKCVRGTCCPGRACGGAEPNCTCARTVEGRAFCQTGGVIVVDPCASSAECAPGEACIREAGGELSTCIPPCGAAP